jgi:DNA-binding NarL/FixJ family response regulator
MDASTPRDHNVTAFDTRSHLLERGDAVDLAIAAWMAVIAEQLGEAHALAVRAGAAIVDSTREGDRLAIMGLQMMVELLDGRGQPNHDLLDELRPHLHEVGRLEALLEIANWYTFLDRYDDAARIVDRRTHDARVSGDVEDLIWSLGCSAELDLRRGRWRQSRRDLVEALMLSEREEARAGYTHVLLARLATYLGDGSTARHHLALARHDAYDLGDRSTIWRADAVEGLLELAEGNPESAAATLGYLDQHWRGHAPALVAVRLWDADLVEALVGIGDLDTARQVTANLAHTPATTWTHAAQHRCFALVAGDTEAAVEAAMASAEAFGAIGAPFEQARSELIAGGLAHRVKRTSVARSLLHRSERTFAALGATTWSAAAQRELALLGSGRLVARHGPDPLDLLTSQERELAVLIVEGFSNKTAATTLHVSVKTVEAHLTRIYRKLDVATRTQLTALLLARDG